MAINRTQYEVPCMEGRKTGEGILKVAVPGSKSVTNRALLLAMLADGKSTLEGVLFSDDTRHFLDCAEKLGFPVEVDEKNQRVVVTGMGGRIPKKEASIYVGSAGTAARFLTALLGISEGTYHLDASGQMKKRPMDALLHSLKQLGTSIEYHEKEGYFPYTLRYQKEQVESPDRRKEVTVDINKSSQFLSALLISSVCLKEGLRIHVNGEHGMSYIGITTDMMREFGVTVVQEGKKEFVIPAGSHYQGRIYQIEPDVSAACYFYAMAPLLNRPVQVNHVHFDLMQGDLGFIHMLQKMGCQVTDEKEGIVVKPPVDGILHGIHADMHACSDQAITMAALAPFAKEETVISGIAHIRLQESDRMKAIVTELERLGVDCEMGEDEIRIKPGTPHAGTVHTYDDHRMAMGFSLIGLKVPGIIIDDPMCCKKTFETYFDVLDELLNDSFSTADKRKDR